MLILTIIFGLDNQQKVTKIDCYRM